MIRRRVIGGATAIFLAATGGIFVQLVSGHDPALARGSQTTTHASTSTVSVASGSSPSSSSSDSGASDSSSGSVTPLTTSAS